jgi:hypothetical protein
MNPEVKAAYRSALRDAQHARQEGQLAVTFAALERAHILGQRYFWSHAWTHVLMLRVGLQRRDRREVLGQIVRLLATVPGYLTGWVPKGNTGGANVSALRPMALPPDLADLLLDYRVSRDVLHRAALLAIALTLYVVIALE